MPRRATFRVEEGDFDLGSTHRVVMSAGGLRFAGEIDLRCPYAPGYRVGCDITYAKVDPRLQGQGLGTLLYQAAAKASCKLGRGPLRSDTQRSKMAEGFWAKQHRKGRAIKEGDRYALTCPAPRSLARYRSRK